MLVPTQQKIENRADINYGLIKFVNKIRQHASAVARKNIFWGVQTFDYLIDLFEKKFLRRRYRTLTK